MSIHTGIRLIIAVAAAGAVTAFAQAPAGGTLAFEVVSIRPSNTNLLNTAIDAGDPCSGGAAARLQVTGSRVAASITTVYGLTAVAYNPWKDPSGGCALARMSDLISGGPDWIKSERFAVDAVIPGGMGPYSAAQFWAGEAPDLQRMLQSLLLERFQLVLHREKKDVPVYVLTLEQNLATAQSRIAASAAAAGGIPARFGEGIFTGFRSETNGNRYASVAFRKQAMSRLAQRLASAATIQRPVVDKTGLAGEFDFVLECDDNALARPTVFGALPEQLGLRLQPSTAPMDVLVIERVDRPSPN